MPPKKLLKAQSRREARESARQLYDDPSLPSESQDEHNKYSSVYYNSSGEPVNANHGLLQRLTQMIWQSTQNLGGQNVALDQNHTKTEDNEISFNQEDSRITQEHYNSSEFKRPHHGNASDPFGRKQISAKELFGSLMINEETRGKALSQIYARYKTIVVTESRTKCSKVITFKTVASSTAVLE